MAKKRNLEKASKLLHKYWKDYSADEINRTKRDHCLGCRYLNGVTTTKLSECGKIEGCYDQNCVIDIDGFRHYVGYAECEYLSKVGEIRNCRPEICPYNESKKGGIKLNEVTHEKFVRFDDALYGCNGCKYKDTPENEEPCHECLSNPTNYESIKPVKFEKRNSQ